MLETTSVERAAVVSREIMDMDLPTRYPHGPVIENRDGSVAIAFRIFPPYFYGTSDANQEALFESVAAAINALPLQYDGQLIFLSANRTYDLDPFDPEIQLKENKVSSITRDYNRATYQKLRERVKEQHLKTPRFYISIVRRNTLSPKEIRKRAGEIIEKSGVKGFEKFKRKLSLWLFSTQEVDLLTEQEFAAACDELGNVADAFHMMIQNAGIRCELLNSGQAREVIYHFFQPNSYNEGGYKIPAPESDTRPYYNTTLKTDFEWDPDGRQIPAGIFKADDAYHAILTVKSPPSEIKYPLWKKFIEDQIIGDNFHLVVNFRQGDIEKRKKKIKDEYESKKALLERKPDLKHEVEELLDELTKLGENIEKTWDVIQAVRIWDKDINNLKRKLTHINTVSESEAGMLLTHETRALWEYFRVIQPFWTQDHDRFRDLPYSTGQLTACLPLIGEPNAHECKPGCLYITTTGGLMNFYPSDRKLPNNNGMIIAGSGQGKSFTTCDIVMQCMKRNPLVIMVDFDRSFENLTKFLGGSHIDLDPNSENSRINLMQYGADALEPVEIEKKVLMLQQLICKPNQELTNSQQSLLIEALKQKIGAGNKAPFFLGDFKRFLDEKFPEAKDMASNLTLWTDGPGGIYGKLFDGPSKFTLNSDQNIVCFEMKKMMEKAELGSIMFTSLVNYVLEMGARFPGREKYLFFDEAHVFLANPVLAKLIELFFRTARKNGFSIIAISQGVKDWGMASNAEAITKNLSNAVFLRQDSPEEAETIGDLFQLPEITVEQLKTIHTRKGHYSQMVHFQRFENLQNIGVSYYFPTPLAYAMSTTDPADKAVLMDLFSEMDRSEAIIEFARRYPKGVAAA